LCGRAGGLGEGEARQREEDEQQPRGDQARSERSAGCTLHDDAFPPRVVANSTIVENPGEL